MNNFRYTLNKIKKSNLKIKPFPFFSINNFLPKNELLRINKILPSFKEIKDQDVYHQVGSETKKILLSKSKIYKKLMRESSFKKLNLLFKKLKPTVIEKFKQPIKNYVNKKYQNSKLNTSSTLNIMKKGYYLKPHIDRREHLITILFYVNSEKSQGGDLKLLELKKKNNKTFDVFPSQKNTKSSKLFKIKNNFCLFTLNVPWSYHSVSRYYGEKDRKYFYFVYDFPTKQIGSKLKNRQKGNNQNIFWKSEVSVLSQKRKNEFFQKKN